MPKSTVHHKRRTRPPKRPHLKVKPEEKAQYLHEIKKQFLAGREIKDIAANLNISESSIYRWQRQADGIQKTLNKSSSICLFNIGNAINRLYLGGVAPRALTIEALFQFLCWIRWPSEPGYYAAAMINCLTSYQKQRFSVQHIDGMDEDCRKVLLKYLTIDVVQRFSSPYAGFNPDFEVTTDAKSRYSDRDFFAQVVLYLISKRSFENRGAHKPTFGTLYTLVEEGVFGAGWSMNASTFKKFWRYRAETFPFLYVEQYHSPFDWSLNPQDQDFAQCVDEIIDNMDNFPVYIGQVRWVISRMVTVLDPRAARRIAFPPFPQMAQPIPVEPPELGADIREKIKALF